MIVPGADVFTIHGKETEWLRFILRGDANNVIKALFIIIHIKKYYAENRDGLGLGHCISTL